MRSGFLLQDDNDKKKDGDDNMGLLRDERSIQGPRLLWGRIPVQSPASSTLPSLGQAKSDWVLPDHATSLAWKGPAPAAAPPSWVQPPSTNMDTTDANTVSTMDLSSLSSSLQPPFTATTKDSTATTPAAPIPAGPVVTTHFVNDRALGPNKTRAVPKAALHALYGRPERRKVLSAQDYVVWDNAGPPHDKRFTAIFVCPITGECFPSGRYGEKPELYTVDDDGTVWFTKKTLAEHGAAARAFDCWALRETPAGQQPALIGMEEPYLAEDALPLPDNLPPLVRQTVEAARKRAERAPPQAMDPKPVDEEEEAAWRQRPDNF